MQSVYSTDSVNRDLRTGNNVIYIRPKIQPRYGYMECTYAHTHIGIRKTRNWLKYETFYYLFEFKVFRHEEGETISFYADFSI